MTARSLLKWPDNRLLKKSSPVEDIDDVVISLANDLYDTMIVEFGAGLAAPQINVLSAVCVINKSYTPSLQPDPINNRCVVLINPEVSFLDKEKFEWEEGCLSVDNFKSQVTRQNKINLKYWDMSGDLHEVVLEGTESATVQHETDHLIGKLFIHRITGLRRSNAFKHFSKIQKKMLAKKKEDQSPDLPSSYKKKKRPKKPKRFGILKKRKK